MIPDSIDPDQLRTILVVVVLVLLVGTFLVIRFVQKLVMKGVMLVVLLGIGASLWVQRADLGDCADTCSCSLYGMDVEVPADQNPNCR